LKDRKAIRMLIQKESKTILVSACLLGINCKYNGKNNLNSDVIRALKGKCFVPICPEQLAGLPTPRVTQSILKGSGEEVLQRKTKVITQEGQDVTREFIRGAKEALQIAKIVEANIAILKECSPSCGVNRIYNKKETASEGLVKGMGVTTAYLKRNKILVFSEEEI
jgi:uncharacterized protein YbbK (DUF523 family)